MNRLRTGLLGLAWLAAAASLYACLMLLEYSWNLYAWEPKLDPPAAGAITGLVAALAATCLLTHTRPNRLGQAVSFTLCLGLLALAVYVLPPEPLTTGLFARTAPSPLWYRATRSVVLALPAGFWCLAWWRQRQGARTAP